MSNDNARVKGVGARRERKGRTAFAARRAFLSIQRLLAAVVVGALALVLGARPGQAAPFDPAGRDWEGYADLTRLLRSEAGSQHVVVTGQLDWGELRPIDSLVVAFPEHTVDASSAGAFIRAGGRLVLLDDFGAGDDLLRSFDIRRVPLPARPALALRENPDLPLAEPSPTPQPLTQGVERVVTNHATGLAQPLLTTVLRVRAVDGPEVAFALSGSSGLGRLLAIGDPSVVMNSMLRYPGNLALAKNIVEYMTEGRPDGKVYLVVGAFEQAGSFGGSGGRAGEWAAALGRAASRVGRDGMPAWMLYWFTFIGVMLVLFWLVPRAMRPYRGVAPRFTRAIPLTAQGGAAGRAAALAAKQAYRGHAMLEWRRALVEDLSAHFRLPGDAPPAELVRRAAWLGVLDREAVRSLEKLLLRMAEIETMIAAKQTHALDPIRDDEVVATGHKVHELLAAVRRTGGHAG